MSRQHFMFLLPFAAACATEPTGTDSRDGDTPCIDTAALVYADLDGDGYGDPQTAVTGDCSAPDDYIITGGDCDDADGSVHPEAIELCNGRDDNCDDAVDEGAPGSVSGWLDLDGDGFGDPAAPLTQCDGAQPLADNDGDCDDGNDAAHPGAAEVCRDGVDQDCVPGGEGCERSSGWAVNDPEGVDVTLVGDNNSQIGDVIAAADINGDGKAELALGSIFGSAHGQAWLFRGPVAAGDTLSDAALRVVGQGDDVSLGVSVALLADRDGDGRGQVLFGDRDGPEAELDHPGAVYLFDSSGDLTTADADVAAFGDDPYGLFAQFVADVGDVDGDGTVDLAVGAPEANARGSGDVYVWSDAPGAGDTAGDADFVLTCTTGSLGYAAVGGFDWNGDGLQDLAVSAPESESDGGSVYVLAGPLVPGEQFVDDGSAEATITHPSAAAWAGWGLAQVGDTDEDGHDDLAVAAPWDGGGVVGIFAGGTRGSVAWSAAIGSMTALTGYDALGYAIASGDIDGDGRMDLVASSPWFTEYGLVSLWYGPLTTSVDASAGGAMWSGAEPGLGLSGAVAVADFNGDSLDDVVMGAYNAEGGAGAVYIAAGWGE